MQNVDEERETFAQPSLPPPHMVRNEHFPPLLCNSDHFLPIMILSKPHFPQVSA